MKKLVIITLSMSLIAFIISFQYAYSWSREVFKFTVRENPYAYIEAFLN